MVERIIEVKVSSLNNGDVLAADVYNPNGKILISKDTVLGDATIAGLKKYFIYSVRIYKTFDIDQESVNIDLRTVIASEAMELIDTHIIKQIRKGKDTQLIKEMILEIMSSTRVSDLLIQIRAVGGNLFRHSVSVAFYSVALGKELHYPDNRTAVLATAAILHDVGMLGINKVLYNKVSEYNDKERALIKKHASIGFEILKEYGFNQEIFSIVAEHHERYDGSGYPNGLTNEKIHIMAKIIGTCDVFDALISDRPYKSRLKRTEMIENLLGSGNMQFNHEIVEALVNTIIIFPYGQWVELTTKEIGIIIDEETKKYNLKPKVLVVFDNEGNRLENPKVLDLSLRENISVQIERVV